MQIEIDQSGRIEYTSHHTVVADSLGNSIFISAKDKRFIQEQYRNLGKPKMFMYQVFAILIHLIIKDYSETHDIVIDIEYPGHDDLIKSYVLQLVSTSNDKNIFANKGLIRFESIGKQSLAHKNALSAYRAKNAQRYVSSEEILEYVWRLLNTKRPSTK